MEIAPNACGRVVERGKLDLLAVQLELALRDAVAVTADDAPPVGVAVVPARGRIEADHDVFQLALAVGREESDDLPAVVAHLENDAAGTLKDEFLRFFAVFRDPKVNDLVRSLSHAYTSCFVIGIL